jgi:type IV fimbrial biogenesis protein FimT
MRASRGFTLIEMMTTVAVIGILLVAGVPAMRGVIENSRIRAASESLKYGLTLARTEAVRRNTQVSFVTDVTGWQVRTVVGDEVLHQAAGTEGPGRLELAITPAGAERVTFDSFGRVLNPNPDPDESAPIEEIDIASVTPPEASGYRPLRVQVLRGGTTRLCDPAADADDPKACL